MTLLNCTHHNQRVAIAELTKILPSPLELQQYDPDQINWDSKGGDGQNWNHTHL